jgi:hemoglobin-like flavoprotein
VREAWAQTYATVQSVMEPALIAAAKDAAAGKEDDGVRQMRLVQESWAVVERDVDAHGVKFFMRIFEIAPGALQLFSFRNVANVGSSPELRAHAGTVMRTVGQAVAGLSDVQSLIPVLRSLGAAHAKYGVQPEHFPIVGQALLWTLEQGLGKLWTPEVRDAWARTYATVQSVMEPALIAAAKESANKHAGLGQSGGQASSKELARDTRAALKEVVGDTVKKAMAAALSRGMEQDQAPAHVKASDSDQPRSAHASIANTNGSMTPKNHAGVNENGSSTPRNHSGPATNSKDVSLREKEERAKRMKHLVCVCVSVCVRACVSICMHVM